MNNMANTGGESILKKKNKKMAKKMITNVIGSVTAWMLVVICCMAVTLQGNAQESGPKLMRVTCYYGGEVTKSGQKPREGICAGPEELMGYLAIVYDKDMNFIGYYEVLDTGSHERLQTGSSIDVWQPTLADCNDWIDQYGDYCYVQLVYAEG